MKKLFALVSVLLLTAVTTTEKSLDITSVAHDHSSHNGHNGQLCNYFPANRLRFPIKEDGTQISRPQFRKILDAVEGVYKPIFQTLGLGRFYIADRWTDDMVNACASVGAPCSEIVKITGTLTLNNLVGKASANPSQDRYVEIYGGLARHPNMTPEGLMLVICHEIGHHLGGYPRYESNKASSSTEGQSDYFATAKCARLVYNAMGSKTNQNWAWTMKNRIPAEVQKPCAAAFGNSDAAIICMRSSLAGLSLAQTLASASNSDPRKISFILKDQSVVQTTYESHPKAQCRLDTYVAGAICGADLRIPFSPNNPNQGACAQNPGARPSCWYKAPTGLAAR